MDQHGTTYYFPIRKSPKTLTRRLVTDVHHHFRRPFHINFHATTFEPFDDNTHSTKSRHEFKCTYNTQFKEMCMLTRIKHSTINIAVINKVTPSPSKLLSRHPPDEIVRFQVDGQRFALKQFVRRWYLWL